LFRPLSERLHSSLRLAIHAGSLIFMAAVFKAGTWIEITSTKRSAVQVAEILKGYNLGIRIAFVVVTIIVLAQIVQEVRRIASFKTPRPWAANGLAAL
jgi:TRAP-type C4-dicarboxylate transport system permease small subunit